MCSAQGSFNTILSSLFNVHPTFVGSFFSRCASLHLSNLAHDANDKHVPQFTQLCQLSHIHFTPITPYLDEDVLTGQSLCIDGTRICHDLPSFHYQHQINPSLVKQQLDAFIEQQLFPPFK